LEFNWLDEAAKEKREYRQETEAKTVLKQHTDDILAELSRGIDGKRRKEESSTSIGKKKEEAVSRPKEGPKESVAKKQQQEYLLQKEKEQD
jgi:hypothetical protein